MRTIVLTRDNIVDNGKNNTMVYDFPNSVDLTGAEVAVSSITMYYSWENINASPLANNTFRYSLDDGSTWYDIVIPDGLYEIADINAYLQFKFIANNHYLVNDAGQYVYYAEIVVNPTQYKIQVNTYPVPTSLPTGWTNPATWTLPTTTYNPKLKFPANFSDIIGFATDFTTDFNSGANTNLSYLSTKTPQVQPNASLLVGMTGISNKYANPSSIIYSVAPNVALGELIIEKPPFYNFNKLIAGTYNRMTIQFFGSDLQPITIKDPNITIILVIRDMDDLVGDIGLEHSQSQGLNAQMLVRNPASNQIGGKGIMAGRGWR